MRPLFVLTRRALIVLAAGTTATRLCFGNSEFWEKKPPEEWTSDEINHLITHSPWAKQVNAEGSSSEGRRGGGGGGGIRLPGGIGFPGGGMGGGRMGGGRGGRGGSGASQQVTGTVRWESAKPILEALKMSMPESLADRYVIGVSGFPSIRSRDSETPDSDMADRLKALTSLQPKGKALAQPGVVEQQVTTTGSSILFGFAKDIVNLDPSDTEVVFSTQLEHLTVKAKFDLKQMTYHGQLAV